MSSEGSYYVEMEAEAQYETEWATMKQRIEYDMPDMNIDRDYVQQKTRKLYLLQHVRCLMMTEYQRVLYPSAENEKSTQPGLDFWVCCRPLSPDQGQEEPREELCEGTSRSTYRKKTLSKKEAMKVLYNNLTSSSDKVSDEIQSYIGGKAAPACLALCEAMQSTLPLELRNLIYAYVSPPDHLFVEIARLVPRCELLDVRHLLDPLYCDSNTRLEAVKYWYESRTFIFEDSDVLEEFLECPASHYTAPLKTLARRFEIDPLVNIAWFDRYKEPSEAASIKLFQAFEGIRSGAKITCGLRYQDCIDRGWCLGDVEYSLYKLLPLLVPIFKRLLDAGHKVILDVEGQATILKYEHSQEGLWQEAMEKICWEVLAQFTIDVEETESDSSDSEGFYSLDGLEEITESEAESSEVSETSDDCEMSERSDDCEMSERSDTSDDSDGSKLQD